MVLKTKKKRQKSTKNNEVVGEDKLSNLPDALLHHILSFLPTKCAMSTCILSRRWKYVVNSITILDFRNWRTKKDTMDQIELETKWFMNFVDTVLLLHENEKPNIQKLYLDIDEEFDEARVNRWISTVMNRKVEEFGLFIKRLSGFSRFHPSSLICDSFLIGDSLTLLDLEFQYMTDGDKFSIANAVSFPKLKILRLTLLRFMNGNLTRFISNFPILEELSLTRCDISEGLCIANPALKHLSVTRSHLSKSTMQISAPNLLTIRYTDHLPADFVLNSFPSLVEADVGFYIYEGYKYRPEEVRVFVKLFEKLSSAKFLKVYANSFTVLSEADILKTYSLTFKNLIHLEISSRYCGSDYSISTMRTFFKFLQLSSNLESIVFSRMIHIPDEEANDCWSLEPKCSLPNLKSITFKGFCGDQKDLNVVKFFLKYVGFLETVTIVASRELSDHFIHFRKQINVMKQLLMFPKPANCVVKFLTMER